MESIEQNLENFVHNVKEVLQHSEESNQLNVKFGAELEESYEMLHQEQERNAILREQLAEA